MKGLARGTLALLALLSTTEQAEAQWNNSPRTPKVAANRVGTRNTPATPRAAVFQTGMASYYFGRHDRVTRFVAAHRTLPFGTWVRVTNSRTGRSVNVKINDRGPFIAGRVIDVSNEAAAVLGMTRSGVAQVSLHILSRP